MWKGDGFWLLDSDRRPMGWPEQTRAEPGEITLGLHIHAPFVPCMDYMLEVRALETEKPGGEIFLSYRTLDRAPKLDVDTNLQSGPQRADEEQYPDRESD